MTDYKLESIVDELAEFIRQVDGNNRMGAGALAEKICERFRVDAPAVQGEPVAWMYSYIGGTEVQTSKERWTGSDWKSYWEETPLCTAHPQGNSYRGHAYPKSQGGEPARLHQAGVHSRKCGSLSEDWGN